MPRDQKYRPQIQIVLNVAEVGNEQAALCEGAQLCSDKHDVLTLLSEVHTVKERLLSIEMPQAIQPARWQIIRSLQFLPSFTL